MLVSPSFQATSVFKTLNPKLNIQLSLHGTEVVEAVLVKFAYNPLPEGSFGPRRDHPDKMEPAKKLNYWQDLAISKSHKMWAGRTLPQYAVLVEEIKEGKYKYEGAMVLPWDGAFRAEGIPPFGRPILGYLTGSQQNGLYEMAGYDQSDSRMDRLDKPVVAIVEVDAENVDDFVEAALARKSDIAETAVGYTGDKFSIDPATGHFIGEDGFRCPRNFEEFWERWPNYIINWTKKRLHKHIVDEDVEDWEMDLLMHMKYLPERSKWRALGKMDVVETFNPELQYGASEKRFRNYINNCLANRFNTIMSKRSKNPICRPGNYSLAAQMDPDNYEVVDDEYVHANSEALSHSSHREQERQELRMYMREFLAFIAKHDAPMVPVVEAISITGTYGDAQRLLNMDEGTFNRARNRVKTLRDSFLNATAVPRQRKPYKTRQRTVAEPTV